jgi:hypothetical protein
VSEIQEDKSITPSFTSPTTAVKPKHKTDTGKILRAIIA